MFMFPLLPFSVMKKVLMRSVKSAEFKYWLMDSRDKVCFPPHVSMREGS
jgi:hypothetical protein